MSEDELKLTRRLFLQHSATATAATATWYSVAMKTDALAGAEEKFPSVLKSDGILPYAYHEGTN